MTNTLAQPFGPVLDSFGYLLNAAVRLVGRFHGKPATQVANFEMVLNQANGGSVLIVELPSAATSHEKCDFDRRFASMLATQPKVIVDMSRLKQVDSSGLGAILRLLRNVTATGGSLKLCAMTKSVRTVFELTRLHHVFDIYGTVDEAMQAFGESCV